MALFLMPAWEAPLEEHAARAKELHTYLIAMWIPCALTLIVMASWLSWIGVKSSKYDDPDRSWESCMFVPKETIYNVDNPLVPSTTIDILGSYINQLVYLAMMVILMTFMGQTAVYRNWNHVTWLVPSGFFGLWCSLLSATYYTASPILPVPSQTTSTVLLMIIWLRKGSWNNIADGSNVCQSAYSFSVAMIAMMCIMILLMGGGTTMAFYVSWRRHKGHDYVRPVEHKGSLGVLLLTLVMCATYIGAFVGKMVTSINSLDCLFDYSTPKSTDGQPVAGLEYSNIYYPFHAGVVNISSLFWAVVFVSTCRAYFSSRVAAYKTCSLAALLYCLTQYPGIVYLLTTYYTERLDDINTCNDYFKDPANAALYIYPNRDQSVQYCTGFRLTSFLGVGLLVEMHIMAAYAYYVYTINKELVPVTEGPDDGDITQEPGVRMSTSNNSTTSQLHGTTLTVTPDI